MKIIDFYKQQQIFSIEVLPPRNGSPIEDIYHTIKSMLAYDIKYVSITHGAATNLRGGTIAIASLIKHKYNIEVLAHLTCLASTPHEVENNIITLYYLGVENVLALRGDPPYGEPDILKHSHYKHASDLLEKINETNQGHYLLRKSDIEFKLVPEGQDYFQGVKTDFSAAAACYPEKHIEASDMETDIDNVKRKVDLGAEFLITQMFFNNEHYWRYAEKLRAKGIDIPIVPGIKPVASYKNIGFLQKMFHCEMPDSLLTKAEQYKDDADAIKKITVEHTIAQSEDLLKNGAPGVHFYTMNKDAQIKEVLRNLTQK